MNDLNDVGPNEPPGAPTPTRGSNEPGGSPAAPSSPERVEALNRAVSTVLMDALNGSNPDYRLPMEEGGFIRWGRVEAAIHATIETSLSNVEAQP